MSSRNHACAMYQSKIVKHNGDGLVLKVVKIHDTICVKGQPVIHSNSLSKWLTSCFIFLPSVQLPVADIPHFRFSECQGLHPSLFQLFGQILKKGKAALETYHGFINRQLLLWCKHLLKALNKRINDGRSLNSLSLPG